MVQCNSIKPEKQWTNFKQKFGKKYLSESEEKSRMEIFKRRYNEMIEHNTKFSKGEVTYKLKINQFSDLNDKELEALNINHSKLEENTFVLRTGGSDYVYPTDPPPVYPRETFKAPQNYRPPESFDWRDYGVLSTVKNQGYRCLSCWAFSAADTISAHLQIHQNISINVSVQNFVDCVPLGCTGSYIQNAFQFAIDQGGVVIDECYPYKARNMKCFNVKNSLVDVIEGFGGVEEGNEEDLKAAIALQGPMAVSLDASGGFTFFSDGVYYKEYCNKGLLEATHGMIIVGYGSENGEDYWLVRDSYGPLAHQGGYVKVARNRNNTCGIATAAVYPILKEIKGDITGCKKTNNQFH